MMLVQIGTLSHLQREALLPCARSKPWLLQHGRQHLAQAAELTEGVALQFLQQQPAKVLLFEALPSPYFAELKRLFAVSGGHFGEQLFSARDAVKQLAAFAKATANRLLETRQQAKSSGGLQDFLHVPIGMAGATPAHFSMGEHSDTYHALIGGATRSGKTTLLNNLIVSACERYAPEDLQLSLLDFKDGVSFWEYEGLAHVAQLYAQPDACFTAALACLERFAAEISARNRLFIEQRVQTLAEYNRLPGKRMPRYVLIVDEAQSLFEGRDYKQKATVKQMLSAIAKKGSGAGLHMILCTQSYQNVELEGDVKEQFHLRIGFRHATGMGCRALMGRDNDAMLSLERFTAIYNGHQGEPQHNRVVELDALPDFLIRLDALKAKFPDALHAGFEAAQNLSAESVEKTPADEGRFAAGDVSEAWD